MKNFTQKPKERKIFFCAGECGKKITPTMYAFSKYCLSCSLKIKKNEQQKNEFIEGRN